MKPDPRKIVLPITSRSYSELEAAVLEWIQGEHCRTIMTMSWPMLGPYRGCVQYRRAINGADLVLPDGMAVVWISRWCRDRIRERLSGPDFFERFSRTASLHQLRYCLLGSTPEVLETMRARLQREFPGIMVTAAIAPPFGNWGNQTDKELVAAVNNSGADVLWVGITAPRQEVWLHHHKHQLRIPVAAAIGAGFDFFAGTRQRAPAWMQRRGLEWLYRVNQEPMRMLPRYLRSLPAALKMLCTCRRRNAEEKRAP